MFLYCRWQQLISQDLIKSFSLTILPYPHVILSGVYGRVHIWIMATNQSQEGGICITSISDLKVIRCTLLSINFYIKLEYLYGHVCPLLLWYVVDAVRVVRIWIWVGRRGQQTSWVWEGATTVSSTVAPVWHRYSFILQFKSLTTL